MTATQKKRLYIIIIIILAASLVIQIAAEGIHEAGLFIAVGFIAAFVFILLAKKVLVAILQKKEDYYASELMESEDGGDENA